MKRRRVKQLNKPPSLLQHLFYKIRLNTPYIDHSLCKSGRHIVEPIDNGTAIFRMFRCTRPDCKYIGTYHDLREKGTRVPLHQGDESHGQL